jgi:hypothetical protein
MGQPVQKRIKQDNYYYEIDWAQFFANLFRFLGFILIAILSLSIMFHLARGLVRKPSPPPKVIYKTIHVSAMTGAQQAYISQCEQNTTPSDKYVNQGIPNVSITPWTCTYAK